MNTRINDLAREYARACFSGNVEVFDSLPVRPSQLAKRLGISLRCTTSIPYDGKYVSSSDFVGGEQQILLRSGLPSERGRFVVAHEIAHALLENAPARIEPSQEEHFANAFAREILVPERYHKYLREKLLEDSSVKEFLALSSGFGLYPSDLILFLRANSKLLEGTGLAVGACEYRGHPKREGVKDWRVLFSAFDAARMFIPPSQRLAKILLPEKGRWDDHPPGDSHFSSLHMPIHDGLKWGISEETEPGTCKYSWLQIRGANNCLPGRVIFTINLETT